MPMLTEFENPIDKAIYERTQGYEVTTKCPDCGDIIKVKVTNGSYIETSCKCGKCSKIIRGI